MGIVPGSIGDYNTVTKDSWLLLRDIAIARFGQPTMTDNYPNPITIQNNYVLYSDKWDLEKRQASLGIVEYLDAHGPILSIADTAVIHKLADSKEAKRKEAVKKAAFPETEPDAKVKADTKAEAAPGTDVGAQGWKTPRPPYPAAALFSRFQGSGSVRISTDASGNVTDVVITAPINPLLDANTRSIARGNWKGPPNSTRTVSVIYQIR